MDMAPILFNGAEPFEQILNIPSTGHMWNLVKIDHAVSEKGIRFHHFIHIYLTQGKGRQPTNFDGT